MECFVWEEILIFLRFVHLNTYMFYPLLPLRRLLSTLFEKTAFRDRKDRQYHQENLGLLQCYSQYDIHNKYEPGNTEFS